MPQHVPRRRYALALVRHWTSMLRQIRMLLSHTSGCSDYWPEDYLMTSMMQPVAARDIIEKWAKRPLDFDPGTQWPYSNTNYIIAGQIVEKVSGEPLLSR